MTPDDAFLQFWKLAPARKGFKVGKREARRKFDQVAESDWPLLLAAIKKYKQYCDATQTMPKDPGRFISNRDDAEYWREWVPEQVPAQSTPVGAVIHDLSARLGMKQ